MRLYGEGPVYGIGDPQSVPPAAFCTECGGELYGGERVFVMDGETMCGECFKDWVLDLLDTSPAILADMVGARAETV